MPTNNPLNDLPLSSEEKNMARKVMSLSKQRNQLQQSPEQDPHLLKSTQSELNSAVENLTGRMFDAKNTDGTNKYTEDQVIAFAFHLQNVAIHNI